MPDLKMLNPAKYLYNLTFIKCSYEPEQTVFISYIYTTLQNVLRR